MSHKATSPPELGTNSIAIVMSTSKYKIQLPKRAYPDSHENAIEGLIRELEAKAGKDTNNSFVAAKVSLLENTKHELRIQSEEASERYGRMWNDGGGDYHA